VIIRISTIGQYRVTDSQASALNELDNQVVDAIDAADETTFHELFARMVQLVQEQGERVDHDTLEGSDVILPPPDTSLAEAAGELRHDGLLPE